MPDATSTPNGRTWRIASVTLAAVRPPASTTRRPAAIRAARVQSIVRPVPPCRSVSCASSTTVVASGTSSTSVSSDRATHVVTGGASRASTAPCNCTTRMPAASARLMSSADGVTKTPTGVVDGGKAATSDARRAGSTARGLSGHNTKPTASAPSSPARTTSSSRVMPHNLMKVTA
jgi:hypothetical protein